MYIYICVHAHLFVYTPDLADSYLQYLHVKISQVEAVLSPTAGWLASAMAFTRVPEGLEHRATLEVSMILKILSGFSLNRPVVRVPSLFLQCT